MAIVTKVFNQASQIGVFNTGTISGVENFTLPEANTFIGKYTVQDISGSCSPVNYITVNTNLGVIRVPNGSAEFLSNGTSWVLLNQSEFTQNTYTTVFYSDYTKVGGDTYTTSTTGVSNSMSVNQDALITPFLTKNNTGAFRIGTNATLNPGLQIRHSQGAGTMVLGNGWFYQGYACAIRTLSASGSDYITRVGFMNAALNTDVTNGVFFEYNRASTGNFWVIATAAAAVRTRVTTTTAITANTNYVLQAIVNANGTSATFYINGALVGTITTNIPTTDNPSPGCGPCYTFYKTGTDLVDREIFVGYKMHVIYKMNAPTFIV